MEASPIMVATTVEIITRAAVVAAIKAKATITKARAEITHLKVILFLRFLF